MIREPFLRVAILAIVALALVAAFFYAPTTSAALDLAGGWKFTMSGDFSGVCATTLSQTGDNITGAFDCPGNADDGQLEGTVSLQGHTRVLHATVTLYHGSVVLDTWNVTADISPVGNNASGTWNATSGSSGTLAGVRDVPIYIKGDLNCDGTVDARDVLAGARWSLEFDPLQQPYCPEIGSDIGVIFGDIDCNGHAEIRDAFVLLRYTAGLPVSSATACLAIGEKYSPAIPT